MARAIAPTEASASSSARSASSKGSVRLRPDTDSHSRPSASSTGTETVVSVSSGRADVSVTASVRSSAVTAPSSAARVSVPRDPLGPFRSGTGWNVMLPSPRSPPSGLGATDPPARAAADRRALPRILGRLGAPYDHPHAQRGCHRVARPGSGRPPSTDSQRHRGVVARWTRSRSPSGPRRAGGGTHAGDARRARRPPRRRAHPTRTPRR